ncbi:hypothetical protein V2W30_22760 [Streptomyces sp. Q6]|uniref:Uncharacterized protein n=1 Tax=Streptomyces citrinus TaxID=3118173 RepID=A0ACD5AG43_9ACTN
MNTRPRSETVPECRAWHPNQVYRCTLPKGHGGQHKHAYSGPVIDGWRRGTHW